MAGHAGPPKGGATKRLALAVAAAAVGLVPACFAPTEPALGSDLLLTGAWVYGGFTPFLAQDYLATRAAGGQLVGQWLEYNRGSLSASAAVSGTYDSTGAFKLRLAYSTGSTASFVGQAYGADYVAGIWTDSAAGLAQNLVFNRTPPPPCADTLPVLGRYLPPTAPSFDVQLRGGMDPSTESQRLSTRYGFILDQVYVSGFKGFSAALTAEELMVLQCEPSVISISYDNGLGPG